MHLREGSSGIGAHREKRRAPVLFPWWEPKRTPWLGDEEEAVLKDRVGT